MARLIIEPIGLHWLGPDCATDDLCVHAGVRVLLDGKELLRSESDDYAVSLGAYYLLQAADDDHLSTTEDYLIPHCAHLMAVVGGRAVNISSCNHGVDWRIRHLSDDRVELRFWDGAALTIPASEWRAGVLKFSQDVRDFYFRSARSPAGDDAEWHAAFCDQWTQLHTSVASRVTDS